MTSKRFDAVLFDAYGTLLDVHVAMARHASRLGSVWKTPAGECRVKQLEHTWSGSLTGAGTRRDFATCTADALDYAPARQDISGPATLRLNVGTGTRTPRAAAERFPFSTAVRNIGMASKRSNLLYFR